MLQYTKRFWSIKKDIGLSFAFWCYFINCWQILGNPSSSQIPGACDSQACCCQLCSTLDSSFIPPVIVVVCVISTGLLYCKVYAAVRHHTGTSSTEWRYGKRCKGQKIYTCYILRVCGVFSLLIANILCGFCQDQWWNHLVISFMVFHIDSCVSQFIHQSLIYCSNMRHIWQTVMDHIWLVRNKKELIQNIFLWWKKPFQQYSWKNDPY